MSGLPRSYRNMEEFEREEIRPGFRVGFSLEDLVHEAEFDGQVAFEPERDEFELDSLESETYDDEEDEDEEAAED
jgi:hypothetical protein